ncbi:MAG TPA: NAD-dependent epimerase/dehydratase family protein [Geobacteraceae bacterium]
MKSILITGICGFLGSTLAKHWLAVEEGLTVYGLDNLIRPGSEQNRQVMQRLGVRLVHGDIRLASDLETLPAVDWVIDAAANPSVLAGTDGHTSSRQVVEHNLLGTANVLEYCKRNNAGFILLSTSRVYSIPALAAIQVEPLGNAFRLKKDQGLPIGLSAAGVSEQFSTAPPITLYGSSKLASEVLAQEYGATFGFPVWINRCGVLAGAGQFGHAGQGIFAYWINAWLRRKPLAYIGFGGQGHQVRDCLHPRDLVPLLQQQTSPGASAAVRVVNLGGGMANAMSLAELSSWCHDRFGPHTVASLPDSRRFDIPWLVMDSAVANTVWNWQPQTARQAILDEIAIHAEQHPQWLELSGVA